MVAAVADAYPYNLRDILWDLSYLSLVNGKSQKAKVSKMARNTNHFFESLIYATLGNT